MFEIWSGPFQFGPDHPGKFDLDHPRMFEIWSRPSQAMLEICPGPFYLSQTILIIIVFALNNFYYNNF